MIDTIPTLINNKWTLNLLPFRASLPHWASLEHERLIAMHNVIHLGDCIVDIGAEQGDLTALYTQWAGPHGKTIIIEPSPGFWPSIRATFEANSMTPHACHQVLVSNRTFAGWNAETSLWPKVSNNIISDSVGFSHLNENPPIPVVKIDDMNLPRVHVMTIDVEGSEYEQVARRNPAVYGGLAAPLVFDIGFDNSQRSTAGRTDEESA